MDLSPIPGVQGRSTNGQSQAPASDFADELKKGVTSKSGDSSRANEAQGKGNGTGAEDPAEMSRDVTAAATSEGGNLPMSASLGDADVASVVATVEQVLSARVFGLHLLASGYLSEYSVASAQPEVAESRAIDSRTESGEIDAPSSATFNAAATVQAAAGDESVATSVGSVIVFERPTSESEFSDVREFCALPPSTSDVWSEIKWQERTLRLFARTDGKHVAWLRDYTLSVDQARQLAAGLTQQLKGQGMTLHSVVWNGHEVWSSADIA